MAGSPVWDPAFFTRGRLDNNSMSNYLPFMTTDRILDLASRVRRRANERITAELERLGHPGLAPTHGAILARLYAEGAQPMSALAQAIGRRKNTVTALVRKLKAAGYVSTRQSAGDSRVTLVALTRKGEAFRADFEAISVALLARTWGDMAQARREAVVAGLEEVLRNLA